eukprot:gene11647-8030_t
MLRRRLSRVALAVGRSGVHYCNGWRAIATISDGSAAVELFSRRCRRRFHGRTTCRSSSGSMATAGCGWALRRTPLCWAPLPPPPRLRTPPPLRPGVGRLPPPPPLAGGTTRAAPGTAPASAPSSSPQEGASPQLTGLQSPGGSSVLTQTSFLLRSPQEVLSTFVDFVPTFYVSMQAIAAILSEDIRSEFQGRGKLLTFFRRYPFFFDLRTDAVSSRFDVRLRSDVSHPRRGAADEKFVLTDVGETAQYVAKPDFIISMDPIDTGNATGSVCVTPPLAPPAVRVNLEERVPVLDRLRALVPEKAFVPIEELEEVLPEDVLFHPYFDCQGGLTAIASKFPEHFQVVRGQIRLRPPDIAPLALDDLSLDASPLPDVAALVYTEVCQETIPRWVSLTPLYERLTLQQRREIKKQFKSFAGFLRAHGRSVSISQDMLQVAKWIPPVCRQANTTTAAKAESNTRRSEQQEAVRSSTSGESAASAQEASLSSSQHSTPLPQTEEMESNAKKEASPGSRTSNTTKDADAATSVVAGVEKDAKAMQDKADPEAPPSASPSSSAASPALDDKHVDRIRSNPRQRMYSRTQLLNSIFDRFPPDQALSPREVYALLPTDLHPSSLPKRLVQWLASFPSYFVLEENGTPIAGLNAFGDEGHAPPRVSRLPDDVPCLRRSSSRQPLDLALVLYKHFPDDTVAAPFETLLDKMNAAQRHVMESMGLEHLIRLLPSWIELVRPETVESASTSGTEAAAAAAASTSLAPLPTGAVGYGQPLLLVKRRQSLQELESAIRSEGSKLEKRGHKEVQAAAAAAASSNPADWVKDFTSIQTLLKQETSAKHLHQHRHPTGGTTSPSHQHYRSAADRGRGGGEGGAQKQPRDTDPIASKPSPSRSATPSDDGESRGDNERRDETDHSSGGGEGNRSERRQWHQRGTNGSSGSKPPRKQLPPPQRQQQRAEGADRGTAPPRGAGSGFGKPPPPSSSRNTPPEPRRSSNSNDNRSSSQADAPPPQQQRHGDHRSAQRQREKEEEEEMRGVNKSKPIHARYRRLPLMTMIFLYSIQKEANTILHQLHEDISYSNRVGTKDAMKINDKLFSSFLSPVFFFPIILLLIIFFPSIAAEVGFSPPPFSPPPRLSFQHPAVTSLCIGSALALAPLLLLLLPGVRAVFSRPLAAIVSLVRLPLLHAYPPHCYPRVPPGIPRYHTNTCAAALRFVHTDSKNTTTTTAPMSDAAPPQHADPVVIDEKAKKVNPKQAEKEARKAARLAEEKARAEAKLALLAKYADTFGAAPLVQSTSYQSKQYSQVGALGTAAPGSEILVRARVSTTRKKGKLAFMVLRDGVDSVQAVAAVDDKGEVPKEMIDYIGQIPVESVVDVVAEVLAAEQAITATSIQNVELKILKIHTVSESQRTLPYTLEDASRKESDEGAKVNFDTRLNARWLDLRTPATNAVFRLQSRVGQFFRQYLIDNEFIEIHVPKIVNAASEGGANVFKLQYFQRAAYLAQSPQLHKQMSLQGDLPRVFEVGPVFRAENSNTHRHLTEFVGLDVEMRINEHYYEVLDVAEGLFDYMFTQLAKCSKELEAVNGQYPFEPLVWKITPEKMEELGVGVINGTPSTDKYGALVHNAGVRMLRINYMHCIELLNTAIEEKLGPTDDINTTNEKLLGKLVKQRYGVDFFISDRFPSSVRPFYTMPCPDDTRFTNSYDMFIRGEEISSGAQRIHDAAMLLQRAESLQVDLKPIIEYVEAFKLGAWPHGGFGVGLERVVMLYLGLPNIRMATLFPRDPQRVAP